MIMSVYLSDDIADVLSCYGTLDDVVNKILQYGAQGIIDIMEKPKIPEKKGGHYYKVDVTEPDYIQLVELYGSKSSRISLRRLLYWFVENEMYVELEWEPVNNYASTQAGKSYKVLMELKQQLYKASRMFPTYRDKFDEFKNLLNEIEETTWYAE